MRLVELQVAFHEMEAALNEYGDAWIITVFPDNDPRVQGGSWQITDRDNPPPTMWMSDDLYALYCASVGMVNEHQR